MPENPYKPPPTESDASPDYDRGPPPAREARLVVLGVLMFASLIISRLLNPDVSTIFASAIPIFLLSVVAYYFGLRHGAK